MIVENDDLFFKKAKELEQYFLEISKILAEFDRLGIFDYDQTYMCNRAMANIRYFTQQKRQDILRKPPYTSLMIL